VTSTAIERLRKYVAECEDAPNWGGPTMLPARPALDDLRAVIATLTPPAAPEIPAGGWIVGSGDGKRWRTWKDGFSAWTENRDEATRYHRREDAEAVHYHDEDAWSVIAYTPTDRPAATAGEVEQASDTLSALRALSTDPESAGTILKLHFKRKHTQADREAIIGALNAAAGRPAALASDRGEIERLREALRKCGDQFTFYADEHRAKADNPAAHYKDAEKSRAKAETNERFANIALTALSERPVPCHAETDRPSPAAYPSTDGAAEIVTPDAGELTSSPG